MTIEDNLTEEDEEELLLPKSRIKSWETEVETTLVQADTSPDSNIDGPAAVTYEGFNHTNKLMTNTKSTTEKS